MDKLIALVTAVRGFLTPARRKALYVLLAAVLGAAAAFGVVTADQADAILTQLDKILGAVALILAAGNVEKAPDAQE